MVSDVVPAVQSIMHRIHTACLTVACLPNDGPRAYVSAWPAYSHEWWDWGNEASQLSDCDIARRFLRPSPFTPSPHQVDDCLPALALLDGCDRQTRIIIAARASQLWSWPDRGWRDVARVAKCSHESARQKHWRAMVLAYTRSIEPRHL